MISPENNDDSGMKEINLHDVEKGCGKKEKRKPKLSKSKSTIRVQTTKRIKVTDLASRVTTTAKRYDEYGGFLFYLTASSILLIFAGSFGLAEIPNYQGLYAAVVSVGIFSLLACTVFMYLSKVGKISINGRERTIFFTLMLVTWTVSVLGFTFYAPYITTNGYFGSWTGFFVSLKLFREHHRKSDYIESMKKIGSNFELLFLSSLIEFGAALSICIRSHYSARIGYALSLGVLSAFLCLPFIVLKKFKTSKTILKALSIFFLGWWGIGVIFCTFSIPFGHTGNGYFGCWASLLLSCVLTYETFRV